MAEAKVDGVRILVIDDEDFVREVVVRGLEGAGYAAEEAANGDAALQMIREFPFDVIITDLRMPGIPGEKILQEALAIFPETIVIIMTGYGTFASVVEAMHKGAHDYLPKPFQLDELIMRVEKSLAERQLRRENTQMRSELQVRYDGANLIGTSGAMHQVYRMMAAVADRTSTVLIMGETGTGKELIAKGIHYSGARRSQPMICINCGAIPANLLEDELFGHVKGAFTGAHQHRIGRFEQANQGTLFLDEIGDMPMDLQAKLLRAIQEKEFQKVGGSSTIRVDVRIIAATNTDLLERVREGEFREDLYYRLNVIPIHVPPLRQRREDIAPLVSHFIKKCCSEQKLQLKRVSHDAIKRLMAFDWPGNVRQLENAIEMAVALSGEREVLDTADFPIVSRDVDEDVLFSAIEIPAEGVCFNTLVSELERRLVLKSLHATGGNKKQAASLLRLKRTTFVEKLKRMGMQDGETSVD